MSMEYKNKNIIWDEKIGVKDKGIPALHLQNFQ